MQNQPKTPHPTVSTPCQNDRPNLNKGGYLPKDGSQAKLLRISPKDGLVDGQDIKRYLELIALGIPFNKATKWSESTRIKAIELLAACSGLLKGNTSTNILNISGDIGSLFKDIARDTETKPKVITKPSPLKRKPQPDLTIQDTINACSEAKAKDNAHCLEYQQKKRDEKSGK